MIRKSSKYSWKMLFMNVVNVAKALHSPKGITHNVSDKPFFPHPLAQSVSDDTLNASRSC